ncbi:unnamed protein product [marine sediment metagenome]|uniref:Uncharacterized protein n=1 Tax=marine sediment metagenome TaxID=412755 RepID=X0ZAU0_9ZZZZ
MPICENCKRNVNSTLQINLPANHKIRKLKKRKKAHICFRCIRNDFPSCLNKDGYWYPIVFPHKILLKDRKKY